MKVLLDTHVLLWLLTDHPMLGARAREIILDADNEIFFSVVSLAEIANKRNFRPELMPIDPAEVRAEALAAHLKELSFEGEHALALVNLPQHHRDPFDRMLIVQAQVSNMILMSHDDFVLGYASTLKV